MQISAPLTFLTHDVAVYPHDTAIAKVHPVHSINSASFTHNDLK